ncbi:hypothetical protein BXZ70DRAFT_960586 [Cristinia sonorae]|uniref:Uncharacterized protein n=1 Tax=Cristinia sonorae TaxID=1940300 RepID=A0A8K0XK56_9AGAR|nr:hypothetical protein BXZ70DRAFT_960586 [Cristinia sonorae]
MPVRVKSKDIQYSMTRLRSLLLRPLTRTQKGLSSFSQSRKWVLYPISSIHLALGLMTLLQASAVISSYGICRSKRYQTLRILAHPLHRLPVPLTRHLLRQRQLRPTRRRRQRQSVRERRELVRHCERPEVRRRRDDDAVADGSGTVLARGGTFFV